MVRYGAGLWPRNWEAAMSLKTSLATVLCLVFWAEAALAEERVPAHVVAQFGSPPTVPEGALPQRVQAALGEVVTHATAQSSWSPADRAAMDVVAASNDPRVAWLLTDMLRFTWRPEFGAALTQAATQIMGIELKTIRHRPEIIDHLIAWDIPAYPGYLQHKRAVFTNYVPGWERILVEGDIDWHLVSWGGVNIDDRPFGTTDDICDCIPAIDDPEVTSAAEATWLEDEDIVFGLEIGGEARAYPRQIMEVRELVNDTLGGRDLAIPYCTLCGAAQAFFTDGMPLGVKRPVMRTSGLLIRSNKVMYDLESASVFDTFLGKAVTGPLAELGVTLEQASVVTTNWGSWKAAHPETTVLAEALALGRDYNLRNTRDAKGPIFPIGDVDPRLPVHEDVIGVTTASGQAVAFPRNTAFAALKNGEEITVENVRLVLDAGGIRAVDATGADLGSHQAFWFAWSQFYPGTLLWPELAAE
jgi:hypothetical protein